MIPEIRQNTSTADVISIITQIVDYYDGTGPENAESPRVATQKLNDIADVLGVERIGSAETATSAMLKINRIGLSLQEQNGPFDFLAERLIAYTSGARANVSSGAVSRLTTLGQSPALVATGGLTVSSKVLTFDGTNDTAAPAPIVTQTGALQLDRAYEMPVASGSGPEGGFTCTGGVPYPLLENAFVAGNDGRNTTGGSNENASIVICQIVRGDVIKVDEFRMLDYPSFITTPGSIQGVTWIDPTNQIGFCHLGMLKVFYIDPVTREMSESPGSAIPDLNGLSYDSETDCVVTGVASNSEFRDRATFTPIGRKVDGGSDGLMYEMDRREMWRTAGPNGTNGTLYICRASAEPASGVDSYQLTLSGADAVEGVWRDGQTLYILNDAGYHPGNPPKNRLLIYTLPTLDSAPMWPTGQTVQFFGKIQMLASAPANARLIVGVGDSQSSIRNGAGLFVPLGTTTQLRTIVNGTAVTWNTPNLTTPRTIFATVRPRDGAAELWVDGVSMGEQTFTAQPLFWLDPSPMYIGSDRGASRFWPGNLYAIGMVVDSDDQREAIERVMAIDLAA